MKSHPYVYYSIIYSSQVIWATLVPIDRGMDKEEVVYVMEYYLEWNVTIP